LQNLSSTYTDSDGGFYSLTQFDVLFTRMRIDPKFNLDKMDEMEARFPEGRNKVLVIFSILIS
jgi:hypothetical protein